MNQPPIHLYALCDQVMLDQRGISLETYVDICKSNNAEIIQYRNKISDNKIIKKQLKKLRELWDKKLIINDAIELHYLCDGVHVGQEDIDKLESNPKEAINKIRKMVGKNKWIGLSTHNRDEIIIANSLDINYIGLGAYRSTGTKIEAKVLGEELDSIASLSVHPVAVIGGVRLSDSFEHITYHVIGSGLIQS